MFRSVISRVGRQAMPVLRRTFATTAAVQRVATTKTMTSTATRLALLTSAGAALTFSGVVAMAHHANGHTDPNADFTAIKAKIVALLDDDADRGPTFVRLAWHSCGSYCNRTHTGGSNGACMRFKPESDHGGNAGLDLARNWLESVKQAHPDISYADLYMLAANVAIAEMGGPSMKTKVGRTDVEEGHYTPTPDGRLPDATQGSSHIRDVFNRMGFTDREMVALIGAAHGIGRCHKEASGFDGPWTRSPTTFSNAYFKELLENTWTERKWNGPRQFEDPTGDLMMLPTDMEFRSDPVFLKWSKVYADDEELLFRDFARAWKKMTENNVKFGADSVYV